jgi:hypothetical protein
MLRLLFGSLTAAAAVEVVEAGQDEGPALRRRQGFGVAGGISVL